MEIKGFLFNLLITFEVILDHINCHHFCFLRFSDFHKLIKDRKIFSLN